MEKNQCRGEENTKTTNITNLNNKEMKIGIEQAEALLREMSRLQQEHPKARIYFDGEEIRITYPLPKDFVGFGKISIDFTN